MKVSIALIIFIFSLTLLKLGQHITQDEILYYLSAQKVVKGEKCRLPAYSPHLYLQSLILTFKLFGSNEKTGRIPSIFAILIALFLIHYIITREGKNKPLASLFSLMFLSTPLIFQGIFIFTIDTCLLIATVTLLCIAYLITFKYNKNYFLLFFATIIAFWTKVTTPSIIFIILILFTLFSKIQQNQKIKIITSLLSGLLVFILTWYIYCKLMDVQFIKPFLYAFGAFKSKTRFSSQIINNILFSALWTGIFPLVLFALLSIERIKEIFHEKEIIPEDIFLLCGSITFIGYLFTGGAIFGFPKYQCPSIALLWIFSAIYLTKRYKNFQKADKYWIIAISAFLIQFFFIGDLIYILRYKLRYAMAFELATKPIVIEIFSKLSYYAILIAILLWTYLKFSKEKVIFSLIYIALGTNLGIIALQSKADYHTGYNYGGKGLFDVCRILRNYPEYEIIAPDEVIYYLGKETYIPDHRWRDTLWICQKLNKKAILVYSIVSNTIEQIKTLRKCKKIKNRLKNYKKYEIGSYIIYHF